MSSPLCGSCAVTFTLFKKKNRCTACRLLYCTSCFKKGQSLSQRNAKHCLRCRALSSNPFIPAELMLLTVKELKDFIQQHNVSSAGCREKQDLVDAIVSHQTPNETTVPSSTPVQQANMSSNRQSSSNTQQQAPPLSSRPDFFGLMRNLSEDLDSSASRTSNNAVNEGFIHSLLHVIDIDGISREAHSTSSSRSQNHDVDVMMDDMSVPEQPSTVWSRKGHDSQPKYTRLETIKNANEIEKLSVKQLKAILDGNFVDYKGCCEKEELVHRTVMLWKSKMTNVNDSSTIDNITGETDLCKVCMDSPVDCVLLECGHLVTCVECGKKLKDCPMCRQNINRIVRVFKS